MFSYGGDTDDLAHWSTLAGHRDDTHTTHDPTGRVASRTTRMVPVITPTQLTSLPRGRVVVFRHGMPVVVGRVRMAWTRHDVSAHTKRTRAATRTVLSTAEALTHTTRPPRAARALLSPARLTRVAAGWVKRLRRRVPRCSPVADARPLRRPPCGSRLTCGSWTPQGSTRATNGTPRVSDPPPS